MRCADRPQSREKERQAGPGSTGTKTQPTTSVRFFGAQPAGARALGATPKIMAAYPPAEGAYDPAAPSHGWGGASGPAERDQLDWAEPPCDTF